jgi:serine/threonine-protein kinase
MERPSDPLIGQLIADRYQILSLIGEGGMGRVYLAEHVRMGRKSAVKVINPALATTADAISRFNREAANACKINHPNVAQVYDFGEMADGTLYLAMEFIDGETLDAVVAREGSLPPRRAAQIAKQIADALYAAHHLGIIHRDLKPENVMIARHLDGTDWVKVVDFGIAKTIQRDGAGSQTVTTAGVSLGTPEYMSPEQLAGDKLDHRTDVYSLGLLLFNMLTGQLPYPKLTSKETLVRRLTSRPSTLSEVSPDRRWPSGLQAALDRAIAPEVADRYDSVADFGRAVVQAADTGDLDAAPASATTVPLAPAVPAATSVPNETRPDDARLDRPMAHRRALPWVIATAAVLGAVALVAQVRAHRDDTVALTQGDTTSVEASVTAAAESSAAAVASSGATSHVEIAMPRPPAPPHATTPTERRAPAEASTLDMRRFSDSVQHAQLRLADSIQRAVTGVPLAKIVRVDSILAQLAPELERVRRQEGMLAGAQRHYWLDPNGDSVGVPPLSSSAPLSARAEAAAREIRGHIALMRGRFESGDVRGARQQFAMAASEIPILRDLDPNPQHSQSLERELAQGVRDVIVSCNERRADSTLATGIRCENVFGIQGRFRQFRQPPR